MKKKNKMKKYCIAWHISLITALAACIAGLILHFIPGRYDLWERICADVAFFSLIISGYCSGIFKGIEYYKDKEEE